MITQISFGHNQGLRLNNKVDVYRGVQARQVRQNLPLRTYVLKYRSGNASLRKSLRSILYQALRRRRVYIAQTPRWAFSLQTVINCSITRTIIITEKSGHQGEKSQLYYQNRRLQNQVLARQIPNNGYGPFSELNRHHIHIVFAEPQRYYTEHAYVI